MGVWGSSPLLHFPASPSGHTWSPRSPRDHRKRGAPRRPGTSCEYAAGAGQGGCLATPLVYLCVYVHQPLCLVSNVFCSWTLWESIRENRVSEGKEEDQTVHVSGLKTEGPNGV